MTVIAKSAQTVKFLHKLICRLLNQCLMITAKNIPSRQKNRKKRKKTPKKLREQLSQFVSRVSTEVDRISEMEDAEEILVEYKKSLNLASAIGIVLDRHRRIQQQREESRSRACAKSAELEAVHKVDAISPPAPVPPPKEERRYTISFTLRPTEAQMNKLRPFLIELKDFLIQEGIEYG